MRYKHWLGLGACVGLLLLATDTDSFGQLRGGGAVGGARGGYVVGPYGGGGGGVRSGGTVIGPGGGIASGGSARGSYTTGRGTTVDYAGAGRAATGPGGISAGRGVGAVHVTTPGGREYSTIGRAGGVVGPGGNGVGSRGSVGVASGPGGKAVGASRVGVAVGPGGAVAGTRRVGVAAGPYGPAHVAGRGVAVGHTTRYVGTTAIRSQGVYVRKSFVHYNAFTPTWYTSHVHVWRPAVWTAAVFWSGAAWATVSSTCGYPAQPIVYDYGSTIVYQDNRVYYNGEPVATADEYATQATEIAVKGQEARASEKEEWVSLGVFGMVQGDEQDANNIFQLAINKEGIIRGTYYNALSDSEAPVYGSVDKRTQRAAWVVGERKDTVYETGIGNLTEPETTMLVHFGKDRTQQWMLVRLDRPEEK